MNCTPASVIPLKSLSPCRLIGLYLARLLAYLVRLETSCPKAASPDDAQRVASAEAMVYGFIRLLAAAQLESAGYTSSAHTMRTQAALWTDTTVQTDSGQATPADLIARVKVIIANFERADALAHLLACIIICARGGAAPETRGPFVLASNVRAKARPLSISYRHTRQLPEPWPPPPGSIQSAGVGRAQAAGGADTPSQTHVGSTRITSGLDLTSP
jgi:hypothetical protein